MSEKSVAEKARVKPTDTIAVVNPVPGVVESLGLPATVAVVSVSEARLVFLFVQSTADLDARLADTVAHLGAGAVLWVFFRKGSKGAGRPVNRDDVWAAAERRGMRPIGLLSVDGEWSAFRLKRGT